MSLNPRAPIRVVKVQDPRTALNAPRYYSVVKGALTNNYQQFATTNTSNSSAQVTMNPPSRDIIVSRLMYKRVTYNIAYSGITNATGGPPLVLGYFAPRCDATNCVTMAESVSLNNDTLTISPVRQFSRALFQWYHNEYKNRQGEASQTLSMPDQSLLYSELIASPRNPLGNYETNQYDTGRAGFDGFVITSNANGASTASATLTVTSPILVSPLVWGEGDDDYCGFINIENASYQCSFAGDLSRVMSMVGPDVYGNGTLIVPPPTVTIDSFNILCNYLTPDPLERIPKQMSSSYFNIISYPTRSTQTVAPQGIITMTLSSIQVQSVPRRVYLFAKTDDSNETVYTTDTYLSLLNSETGPQAQPVTVQWNNNILLSSCTTNDIYNICLKNGLTMSYTQFISKVGSVICLDFSTDISMVDPSISSGSLGNYQFSATINFQNKSTVPMVNPTFYAVMISEGVFNINEDGTCSHAIGVLSKYDVINAQYDPRVSWKRSHNVYGGKIWETVKGLASKAHDYIKKNKLISKGLKLAPHPAAQFASKVAQRFGYGMSGGMSGGRGHTKKKHVGRPRKHRRMRGAGLEEEQHIEIGVETDETSTGSEYSENEQYEHEQEKQVQFEDDYITENEYDKLNNKFRDLLSK